MVETHIDPDKVDVIETWSAPKKAWVPGGEAVAALMAAMIEMLTLAAVNQGTDIWPAFNTWVHGAGELWMPWAPKGSDRIPVATTWIWPPVFNGVARLVAGH